MRTDAPTSTRLQVKPDIHTKYTQEWNQMLLQNTLSSESRCSYNNTTGFWNQMFILKHNQGLKPDVPTKTQPGIETRCSY